MPPLAQGSEKLPHGSPKDGDKDQMGAGSRDMMLSSCPPDTCLQQPLTRLAFLILLLIPTVPAPAPEVPGLSLIPTPPPFLFFFSALPSPASGSIPRKQDNKDQEGG